MNDAVKVRMEGGVMEECEASADVLLSDTMDQYRTFQMGERLLYSPTKLGNQLLFQIPPHLQTVLIERCKDDVINFNSMLFHCHLLRIYHTLTVPNIYVKVVKDFCMFGILFGDHVSSLNTYLPLWAVILG